MILSNENGREKIMFSKNQQKSGFFDTRCRGNYQYLQFFSLKNCVFVILMKKTGSRDRCSSWKTKTQKNKTHIAEQHAPPTRV